MYKPGIRTGPAFKESVWVIEVHVQYMVHREASLPRDKVKISRAQTVRRPYIDGGFILFEDN